MLLQLPLPLQCAAGAAQSQTGLLQLAQARPVIADAGAQPPFQQQLQRCPGDAASALVAPLLPGLQGQAQPPELIELPIAAAQGLPGQLRGLPA